MLIRLEVMLRLLVLVFGLPIDALRSLVILSLSSFKVYSSSLNFSTSFSLSSAVSICTWIYAISYSKEVTLSLRRSFSSSKNSFSLFKISMFWVLYISWFFCSCTLSASLMFSLFFLASSYFISVKFYLRDVICRSCWLSWNSLS